MGQTLSVVSENRELPRAKKCPPRGKNLRHILPFELFLREIWPEDRTKNYMRLTGAKLRTAKHRVSGKYQPDYEEVAAVLRSEHGYLLLKHIMGDARPEWFSRVERAKDLGALRRSVAEQQRKITQMELGIE
jgi:hypothetical protein